MKFSIKQFNERFPTSDACLEELKQLRFADFACPKCERKNMLSKITGRPQYACACGYQVAPLAGTIFHKSSTDLRTWFLTMFLMTQTRGGVSAKTIERATGVTYKTAWRMMKQIRSLMDTDNMLSGVVEADEAYMRPNNERDMRLPRGKRTSDGSILFGVVERGGSAVIKKIPHAGTGPLHGAISEHVEGGSTVYTDGWTAYRSLPKLGYEHGWVDHAKHQFMRGKVGTQTIESFWGAFKRGFKGSYIHCGDAYLQSYANEYAWRYSNRKSDVPMFELLLGRLA
jgi:transposase